MMKSNTLLRPQSTGKGKQEPFQKTVYTVCLVSLVSLVFSITKETAETKETG